MSIPQLTKLSADSRHGALLVGCTLLGPIVFLSLSSFLYAWLSGYCQVGDAGSELTSVLLAALLAGGAFWSCLRALQRTSHGEPARPTRRARVIAYVGLALNGFSLTLLLGLTLPIVLLRPCE